MFAFDIFNDFFPSPASAPAPTRQQPPKLSVEDLDRQLKAAIISAERCEEESKKAEKDRERKDNHDRDLRQEEAVETARLIDIVNEKTARFFESDEELRIISQEMELLKIRILETATESSDVQVEIIESLRREESSQNVENAKDSTADALRRSV